MEKERSKVQNAAAAQELGMQQLRDELATAQVELASVQSEVAALRKENEIWQQDRDRLKIDLADGMGFGRETHPEFQQQPGINEIKRLEATGVAGTQRDDSALDRKTVAGVVTTIE